MAALSLNIYDSDGSPAEASPADSYRRGSPLYRNRRACFVAQHLPPPPRAAELSDGPQCDGGSRRERFPFSAAYLGGARAYGGGLQVFRRAGGGAGDRKP